MYLCCTVDEELESIEGKRVVVATRRDELKWMILRESLLRIFACYQKSFDFCCKVGDDSFFLFEFCDIELELRTEIRGIGIAIFVEDFCEHDDLAISKDISWDKAHA